MNRVGEQLGNKKPMHLEATYSGWVSVDLTQYEDYDKIDWKEVSSVWMKHTELIIAMNNGDEHNLGMHPDYEIDLKWPIGIKLLDKDWDTIYEEGQS